MRSFFTELGKTTSIAGKVLQAELPIKAKAAVDLGNSFGEKHGALASTLMRLILTNYDKFAAQLDLIKPENMQTSKQTPNNIVQQNTTKILATSGNKTNAAFGAMKPPNPFA